MQKFLSKSWALLALVAIAQILALVWMVADRISLINSSRTVILKTVPVDPRALFRGDYVRLSYEISPIGGKFLPKGETFKRNDYGYVIMEPQGQQPAKPVGVTKNMPRDLKPDQIVIRGIVTGTWTLSRAC